MTTDDPGANGYPPLTIEELRALCDKLLDIFQERDTPGPWAVGAMVNIIANMVVRSSAPTATLESTVVMLRELVDSKLRLTRPHATVRP